ncbi:MAG: signal recognition particle receptor subunit alpha, partial [Acidobacteria bacterium]|nr:signal recognition particle receptor subunit alpha [Acidobacteriota bacterium]
MGLFWKRKSGDQFVSLRLNEPLPEKTYEKAPVQAPGDRAEKSAETSGSLSARESSHPARGEQAASGDSLTSSAAAAIVPVAAGAGPTPLPTQTTTRESDQHPSLNAAETTPPSLNQQKSVAPVVPSRSPFVTSVLGLNLSIEELQAQELALEQEFSARFRRAVSATRESLSERLDTVFQGLKQIDETLLDELEEALIAADIGVATTQHILETVRRGVARKQINDLDALKQAIKDELLKILRQSQEQGVASETSIPENVSPYVMMIVGVNGVGKTTTIGKLAQRI